MMVKSPGLSLPLPSAAQVAMGLLAQSESTWPVYFARLCAQPLVLSRSQQMERAAWNLCHGVEHTVKSSSSVVWSLGPPPERPGRC